MSMALLQEYLTPKAVGHEMRSNRFVDNFEKSILQKTKYWVVAAKEPW